MLGNTLVMSRPPVRIGSLAPRQMAVNRHFLSLRECLFIFTKCELCAVETKTPNKTVYHVLFGV